jgi:hypothetical protein
VALVFPSLLLRPTQRRGDLTLLGSQLRAPASTIVTWNTASGYNKYAGIALSNNNLTATDDGSGTFETVRANLPTAVSSFRFEVTLSGGSTPTNASIGIDNGLTNFATANSVPGSADNNGVQVQLFSGNWYILRSGGVSQGPFASPAPASGQIVTVVGNQGAGTLAFYVNGAQIGATETGVSFSNWYADFSGKDGATSVGTANFSGPFSYGTGSAYDGTTSVVSHDTTGALTGPGSTIAGAAVYNAVHPTSGVLTGPGSTISGSAARTREHATTSILTGPGSTIAGVAVYNAKHDHLRSAHRPRLCCRRGCCEDARARHYRSSHGAGGNHCWHGGL